MPEQNDDVSADLENEEDPDTFEPGDVPDLQVQL